jgi:AcrR family transcriptional regulator
MSTVTSGTRHYRSTLRADQVRQTRRRICDAAEGLFLDRGYVSTSMDDIARAAGVSRQTVFSAFGSKATLLKAVLDIRLVGDDEPVAIADRPAAQAVLAATDPHEAIRLQAALVVEVYQRTMPLWPTLTAGAFMDPELRELVDFYEQGLREGPTVLVDVIARLGALRRDRSRRNLKEAMYLLVHPTTMHNASRLGWSANDLERWLAESLTALLLVPTPAP